MIYFPNAKINLGLHIIEKRADGFHNLETVFYPIDLSDILEILPHPEFEFTLSGVRVEGEANNNLCVKAYKLLKNEFDVPPIYMQLHKVIPMGAGLGGGSADAAFVLKALNSEFNLGLSTGQLKVYATKLGSDCAFFIENEPAIATGRGEVLSPVNLNLSGFYLVLVKPDIHISTVEAYSNICPRKPQIQLLDIITKPIDSWKDYLVNDFEEGIFKQYPIIASIKEKLYNLGAIYAAMSGSGSTVFGIFKNKVNLETYFNDFFVYEKVID